MKVLAALGDDVEGAPAYIPLNMSPLGPGLVRTAGSLATLEAGLKWMVLMNFLFMSEVTICSSVII